jgi:hypothetical protein
MSLYNLNKDMLIKLINTIENREAKILRQICKLNGIKVMKKIKYDYKTTKDDLINILCKLGYFYNYEVMYYSELLGINGSFVLYICDITTCYNFIIGSYNKGKTNVCYLCKKCLCESHNQGKIFAGLCNICWTKKLIR